MRLLQRTEPSTFDKLTGIAQRWQASRSAEPKPELRLTREQALADLRARGMDVDRYLEWESQRSQEELDPGEVEDRWGVKADE
jgi:hypothetical protein